MLRIASACAYRAACGASAELATYSTAVTSNSLLLHAARPAVTPALTLLAHTSTAAAPWQRCQQNLFPAASAGAYRWSTGVSVSLTSPLAVVVKRLHCGCQCQSLLDGTCVPLCSPVMPKGIQVQVTATILCILLLHPVS